MDNSTDRELSTTIQIGDDQYRIRKMVALDGAYLAKILISKLIPLLNAAKDAFAPDDSPAEHASEASEEAKDSVANEAEKGISMIPEILDSISQEDTSKLMRLSLNYADKMLDAGWTPIMNGKYFAVKDAEYDSILCMTLMIHVIMYNAQSFLAGSGSLLPGLMTNLISQPSRPTSKKGRTSR